MASGDQRQWTCHRLIHRFGFNPQDIVMLLNEQADRQGILEAFEFVSNILSNEVVGVTITTKDIKCLIDDTVNVVGLPWRGEHRVQIFWILIELHFQLDPNTNINFLISAEENASVVDRAAMRGHYQIVHDVIRQPHIEFDESQISKLLFHAFEGSKLTY